MISHILTEFLKRFSLFSIQGFGRLVSLLVMSVLIWGSDERVFRGLYGVVHSKSSWAVETKAGVDIILEAIVEGVQVLFQIHIEEGESPLLVIQCHSYPHWVHCDSQVRTPTMMEELIFMP